MRVLVASGGAEATRSYLLLADDGVGALLVDAGKGAEAFLTTLAKRRLLAILLTHAHAERIALLGTIREATGAPCAVGEAERDWLSDPIRNRSAGPPWPGGPIVAPPADWALEEGRLSFAGFPPLTVWATPGHSPGHHAFLIGDHVFSGDALLATGPLPPRPPEGDRACLDESVRRLLSLPDERLLLPGRGSLTTIGDVRRRLDVPQPR